MDSLEVPRDIITAALVGTSWKVTLGADLGNILLDGLEKVRPPHVPVDIFFLSTADATDTALLRASVVLLMLSQLTWVLIQFRALAVACGALVPAIDHDKTAGCNFGFVRGVIRIISRFGRRGGFFRRAIKEVVLGRREARLA